MQSWPQETCANPQPTEGRLIKAGKSLSVADVRIHDEAGTLVASGRGAYNM